MINNEFYNSLGNDWWTAKDHMIYFLRAESKIKLEYLYQFFPDIKGLKILDIGCGAGFISLPLLEKGAEITALDCSQPSLDLLINKAKEAGLNSKLKTIYTDACSPNLQLEKNYDLILAFDVLEHVKEPLQLIKNAKQFLKPNGQFFYHTLNRSLWCWFLYLQLAPRLIKRNPGDIHKHEFNIKPSEMINWLNSAGFIPSEQIGMQAPLFQKANWELLTTRKINGELYFEFTKELSLGYLGRGL